jgi:hypothetical protein
MCLLTTACTVAIVFARSAGSEAMYCAGDLDVRWWFHGFVIFPHEVYHQGFENQPTSGGPSKPFWLTAIPPMLDIETGWTLNARSTTSSSWRKCSRRRIFGHSTPATSLRPIDDTTRCWRKVRGLSFGSGMVSVAALRLQSCDCREEGASSRAAK